MDSFEELEKKLKARIGRLPPEKIVFVGVGNRLRGDDAIGPLTIDLLKDRIPNAIDAGMEEALEKLAAAIIDSVKL